MSTLFNNNGILNAIQNEIPCLKHEAFGMHEQLPVVNGWYQQIFYPQKRAHFWELKRTKEGEKEKKLKNVSINWLG